MDQGIQSRVRLWLRSEQAMGLNSVLMTESAMVHTQSAPRPLARTPQPEPRNPNPEPQSPTPDPRPLNPTPSLSREQKIAALEALKKSEVEGCRKCVLHQKRTHTVFGEGDPDAQIFFIGEGPGETEDLTGRPFVGKAGQLLDRMIAGMGLQRQQVFIANIVKCRPPGNREPAPDEVATCIPVLVRQIEIVRPKVIVTLGKPAAHHLLQSKIPISKLRGTWQQWRGIKVMPTFHPSYVLRVYTPQIRGQVWSDLQMVMAELGLAK